jgi:hypothetical protein
MCSRNGPPVGDHGHAYLLRHRAESGHHSAVVDHAVLLVEAGTGRSTTTSTTARGFPRLTGPAGGHRRVYSGSAGAGPLPPGGARHRRSGAGPPCTELAFLRLAASARALAAARTAARSTPSGTGLLSKSRMVPSGHQVVCELPHPGQGNLGRNGGPGCRRPNRLGTSCLVARHLDCVPDPRTPGVAAGSVRPGSVPRTPRWRGARRARARA